jgi:hypothetical protein
MFDITHDIWEGIGKLEICLLINQFIKIDKFFDLNFLNDRINLCDYGIAEKKNKPSSILVDGSKLKVKEKASKTYTLFRFLPFLIGDKIPENNEYWTVLNVQYPSEATNIYKFIEIIYGVNFGEKVPSLLVELDNKILNLV